MKGNVFHFEPFCLIWVEIYFARVEAGNKLQHVDDYGMEREETTRVKGFKPDNKQMHQNEPSGFLSSNRRARDFALGVSTCAPLLFAVHVHGAWVSWLQGSKVQLLNWRKKKK